LLLAPFCPILDARVFFWLMKRFLLSALLVVFLVLGFHTTPVIAANTNPSSLNQADIHGLVTRLRVVHDLKESGVLSSQQSDAESQKILTRASSILGRRVTVADLENYEGLSLLNSIGLVFSILGGVAVALGFAYGFRSLSPESLDALLMLLGVGLLFGGAPLAASIPQISTSEFVRGTLQFLGASLGTAAVLRFVDRNNLDRKSLPYALLAGAYAGLTVALEFPLFGAATAIAAGVAVMNALEDKAIRRLGLSMLATVFIGVPFAALGFLLYALAPLSSVAIFASGFAWVGSVALMGGITGWASKWELTEETGFKASFLYWPLQALATVVFTGLFSVGLWLHLPALTALVALGIAVFVLSKYLELASRIKELWLRIIGGGIVLIAIGLTLVSVVGALLR
jgi:hypothetical protein